MKAQLMAPIASIHGKISDKYYARVVNGKQIIQRCPTRNYPPTEKQLEARKRFAERYRKSPRSRGSIETTSLPLATSQDGAHNAPFPKFIIQNS